MPLHPGPFLSLAAALVTFLPGGFGKVEKDKTFVLGDVNGMSTLDCIKGGKIFKKKMFQYTGNALNDMAVLQIQRRHFAVQFTCGHGSGSPSLKNTESSTVGALELHCCNNCGGYFYCEKYYTQGKHYREC